MDAVWLPVMWKSAPLEGAVSSMKHARREALLVEDDKGYDVVLLRDIEVAMTQGIRTLAQMSGSSVYVVDSADAKLSGVDLIRPLRTVPQYEALLDLKGHSYALVAHAYEMALVVTRYEGQRAEMAPANTYYCAGGS
jgi:hypothetical protein